MSCVVRYTRPRTAQRLSQHNRGKKNSKVRAAVESTPSALFKANRVVTPFGAVAHRLHVCTAEYSVVSHVFGGPACHSKGLNCWLDAAVMLAATVTPLRCHVLQLGQRSAFSKHSNREVMSLPHGLGALIQVIIDGNEDSNSGAEWRVAATCRQEYQPVWDWFQRHGFAYGQTHCSLRALLLILTECMPFHLNSGLPVDSSGWILCNISTCTTTQSILSALAKSSKGFNNVYIVAFNTGYAIAKSFSAELLDSLTQKYHLVSFLSFFLHPKSEFCHYKVVAPTTFGWWVYDDLMAFGDLSFQGGLIPDIEENLHKEALLQRVPAFVVKKD